MCELLWINLPGFSCGCVSQMLVVILKDHQPIRSVIFQTPPTPPPSSASFFLLSHTRHPFRINSTFTDPQTSCFSPRNHFAEHNLSDQRLASTNNIVAVVPNTSHFSGVRCTSCVLHSFVDTVTLDFHPASLCLLEVTT